MNAPLDTLTCGHLCLTLLHSLWQVPLLAVIVKAIGLLAPQRTQLRYAVSVVALFLGLVALPVTYLQISLAPREPMTSMEFEAASRPLAKNTENAAALEATGSTAPSRTSEPSLAANSVLPPATSALPEPERRWWPMITVLVSIAYLFGVAVMLARLARAAMRVEKVRLGSEKISTEPVRRLLEECSRRIGMTVIPQLVQSSSIAIPKVVGLIRPIVLLPTSAITGLSESELEMILTHELSHIQRHDLWVNCGQRIAETFLFFNPTAWYLSREISALREFCCDDLTCATVTGRIKQPKIRYAEALLNTLELTRQDVDTAPVAIAISGQGPSEIRRRVVRLLGEPMNDSLRQTRMSIVFIVAISTLLFAIPQFAKSQTSDQAEPSKVAPAETVTKTEDQALPDAEPLKGTNRFVPDEADATVATARKRTFDLRDVRKIAFQQTYRGTKVEAMQTYPDSQLESLWKARNGKFGKEMFRPQHNTIALEADSLLLLRHSEFEDGKSWTQAKFWTGKEGWIGEKSSDAKKNVYRYADVGKLFYGIYPSNYPHWDAAGGRVLWGGPSVLLKESANSPDKTDYAYSKTEVIDGEECDVFDGPGRSEKIWVSKSTGLLKAMSRHYGGVPQDRWSEFASKVCGRKISNRQEYTAWIKAQSDATRELISLRWSEEAWPYTEPGNLSVFSDYREIAPGVQWPMQVDRIVVHSNWNGTKSTGTYKYYYNKITTDKVLESFEMTDLAKAALPEVGLKVTDRRGEVPVEYSWTENFTEEDAQRVLSTELAEKRKRDEEIQAINETPINSVDDAFRILEEGPKVDPVKVWARAIKYLTEHREAAVPKLIAAIDREKRDHPLSKFAFAARAIGDRRTVPALIRAIPRTLLPGRSDYGLIIKDDELGAFLQRHDLDAGNGGSSNDAWRFDYGRAQREVFGALQSLTGQKMDEFELRFVHLNGTETQQQAAIRQFHRVATQWATWWEANWKTLLDDKTYSNVGLSGISEQQTTIARTFTLPVGAELKLETVAKRGTVQLVSEENSSCCFLDLDTGRTAGWPKTLGKKPGVNQDPTDSALLKWALEEGFDVMGVAVTPPGKEQPSFSLKPLAMQAWEITPQEYQRLPQAIQGKRPYPISRPVKTLVPKPPKDSKKRAEGENAFLYITNEGTAGVILLTSQVTEIGGGGNAYSANTSYYTSGFFRGVNYDLQTLTLPARLKR